MGSLYSMSGLFFERVPKGLIPFGGSFVRENEDSESPIIGNLTDSYGVSSIEGKLGDSKFEFEKKYSHREDIINYEFTFDEEEGLWKGKYSTFGIEGVVVCKIHEDFRGLHSAFRTAESTAKDMIEMMVEDGYIERVKDPKTGEDLIKPR